MRNWKINRKNKERKHIKNRKKKKKKKKRKKRKKISVYMNAKSFGLNCRKREKWDNKSLLRFQ